MGMSGAGTCLGIIFVSRIQKQATICKILYKTSIFELKWCLLVVFDPFMRVKRVLSVHSS